MREVVLDTETTGLSPHEGHRIVEIGGVELINHVPTGEVYHQYINPERDMPQEAFNVHGLSEEFLRGHPKFEEIAPAFCEFADGAVLVIHNAPFDMAFINAELDWIKRPAIPEEQVLDTLAMARRKHPMGPNSLDALCRRYSVDNSNRTKHGALLDAELLAAVYLELIGGRQRDLAISAARSPAAGTTPVRKQTMAQARPRQLASRLTDMEKNSHAEMVANLGDGAMWPRYSDN
ncbi:MAG: DNA polymerase III subunit epsilon [Pseudomonadota bacterium]